MKKVIKMRKKLITVFLVAIMILVTFSSTASAAEVVNCDVPTSTSAAAQGKMIIEHFLYVKQSGIHLIIYQLGNEWTMRLEKFYNVNSSDEEISSNDTAELPEPEMYEPPHYRPVPPPAAPEDELPPKPEMYEPPYYRPVPPPAAPEDELPPEPEMYEPPYYRPVPPPAAPEGEPSDYEQMSPSPVL